VTQQSSKIKTQVESFTLDHTKVLAPYVRLIGSEKGRHGDRIANFDIRLTQPNVQFLDPSSMHTIEHSAAGLLRDYLAGSGVRLIDSSPFGCDTGFHNIVWVDDESLADEQLVELMAAAWTDALTRILDFSEEDVPATTERECGTAAMHSLHGAKMWARRILAKGFSTDPYVRKGPFIRD
jgi:S-ribosylhomocysteine lyase